MRPIERAIEHTKRTKESIQWLQCFVHVIRFINSYSSPGIRLIQDVLMRHCEHYAWKRSIQRDHQAVPPGTTPAGNAALYRSLQEVKGVVS